MIEILVFKIVSFSKKLKEVNIVNSLSGTIIKIVLIKSYETYSLIENNKFCSLKISL